MTESPPALTMSQKNSILLVAHHHVKQHETADQTILSLSQAFKLAPESIRSYLDQLYDLEDLFSRRNAPNNEEPTQDTPQKDITNDGALAESPERSRRTSSPLKSPASSSNKRAAYEEDEVGIQNEPGVQSAGEAEHEHEDGTDETEEGTEDSDAVKRPSRIRRTSSALPEVLVTPVKRPRRR